MGIGSTNTRAIFLIGLEIVGLGYLPPNLGGTTDVHESKALSITALIYNTLAQPQ